MHRGHLIRHLVRKGKVFHVSVTSETIQKLNSLTKLNFLQLFHSKTIIQLKSFNFRFWVDFA
jgi:hypothetical protein